MSTFKILSVVLLVIVILKGDFPRHGFYHIVFDNNFTDVWPFLTEPLNLTVEFPSPRNEKLIDKILQPLYIVVKLLTTIPLKEFTILCNTPMTP